LAEDQQSILSYMWDFGDDSSGTGSSASHTYSYAGTYDITLTIASTSGESASRSKSVAITKPPDILLNTWRSFDVSIQPGTPQATLSDGTTIVNLKFYESVDDDGVDMGELLTPHNSGEHPDSFNHLENYWGEDYPYVGKSNVPQGSDTKEHKERVPGVFDLQLHPPNNEHLVVCSFEAPFSGNYTISDLGIRRVEDENSGTELKLFDTDKNLISKLSGTSKTWNYDLHTHPLKNLDQGDLIYFAVDNIDGFAYDAVEISWNIRFDGPGTGYANSNDIQDIQIYPNPSAGLMHLTFVSTLINVDPTLYIKDLMGREIDAIDLKSQDLILDLTHFPAGIYFLQYGGVSKRIIIS